MPLGPSDVVRVAYAVRSIRQHAAAYRIVLVLDGVAPESLPPGVIGDDLVVRVNERPSRGHWGQIWLGQCRAMIAALGWDDLAPDAVFVKFDADALLVRAGIGDRARALFASRPDVGQLGQCFNNVRGAALPNAGWARFYRLICGWRGLLRLPAAATRHGRSPLAGLSAWIRLRALVAKAQSEGYRLGEFAIGGCYILRRELVERLGAGDMLAVTPFGLLPTTGEDGVMTVYVYAAGFSAMDDGADGGIFAVEGKNFRVSPFLLRDRGHYVLHPLKYGYSAQARSYTEEELVDSLLAGLAPMAADGGRP
ncbi:MAG: hypothetical protein JNM50_11240 [Chromatiales bacterium]|nr:hypothetical protein [Chromatiales bacterium]